MEPCLSKKCPENRCLQLSRYWGCAARSRSGGDAVLERMRLVGGGPGAFFVRAPCPPPTAYRKTR